MCHKWKHPANVVASTLSKWQQKINFLSYKLEENMLHASMKEAHKYQSTFFFIKKCCLFENFKSKKAHNIYHAENGLMICIIAV